MNNHFKLLYKNLDKVSLRATLKNIEDKLNETENLRIEAVEENERLDNIIDELEKRLEEEIKEGRPKDHLWLMGYYDASKDCLNKLKELKEGK